ncbi:MAG: hypothetical protein NTV27_05155 [Chloroflexi bacterium]|nr:hypothetical protein [Chloroflexota bacterium]
MLAAINRGAALAAIGNLALWIVASIVGVVPPIGETVPTVVGVAFASVGGVAAAGIVARIFLSKWRRYLWDRAALVVLLMSLGSPLGLALGVIPVSPIDPTNELLISFKEGIALIYTLMHFTTYFAVQRTVAKEFSA